MECMKIEKRAFNGRIRALDLTNEFDLAYIRATFKRRLCKSKPTEARLVNNKLEWTMINFETSFIEPLDLTTSKDRNKLLSAIQNWIDKEVKEGNAPYKIQIKI